MPRPEDPIQIAVLVNEFPKVSQTFVQAQIAGLVQGGHDVTVFPKSRSHDRPLRDGDMSLRLYQRTVYPPRPPEGTIGRIRGLVRMSAANGAAPSRRQIISLMGQLGVRESLQAGHSFRPLIERARDYDLYYCHFGPNGLRAVQMKKAGIIHGKIVTEFHGYDVTRMVKRHGPGYYAPLFEHGDLILTVSQRWKERLVSLGCDPDKILVHRLGVDPARFRMSRRDRDHGPLRLLSVSRLVEKKGIDHAVKALRSLPRGLDFEYTVIGDGPLREPLRRLAQQSGLGSRVRFLGARPDEDILKELARADVFLAPSVTSSDGDQEGVPVAIMEAMAAGLPVISTWHSGIPELVEDGASGFLVPERDPQGIAQGIQRLGSNRDLAVRMGRRGRQIVESDYNLAKSQQRLLQILEKVHLGGL